jgi:hypothetical protein
MPRVALAAAGALALATGWASAQVAFGEIDSDGDGLLSYDEVQAVFGTSGANGLFANDADGDGLLTVAEAVGSGSDEEGDPGAGDGPTEADEVEYTDLDKGHGNDPYGFDEDNPGQGHGDDGVPGGGNGNGGGGNGGGGNGNGNDGGGNGNGGGGNGNGNGG